MGFNAQIQFNKIGINGLFWNRNANVTDIPLTGFSSFNLNVGDWIVWQDTTNAIPKFNQILSITGSTVYLDDPGAGAGGVCNVFYAGVGVINIDLVERLNAASPGIYQVSTGNPGGGGLTNVVMLTSSYINSNNYIASAMILEGYGINNRSVPILISASNGAAYDCECWSFLMLDDQ